MRHPRLLDLCCGVGGASVGYVRAGWDVTGVDIADQPDYPFAFVRGDAVAFVREHGREFDAIHASWPCQAENPLTTGTNGRRHPHPQLIPPGRAAMQATGRPWVIENTAGAPIRKDLRLVGDMFTDSAGAFLLSVWRPRYFEVSGFTIDQPVMPRRRGRTRGWRHGSYYDGPYLAVYGDGGGKGTVAEWRAAMGIDWTTNRRSLAEAIPPAYTQYIGAHLITALTRTTFTSEGARNAA
jgi:DNA (cytosine-5)-methyltransferase 1